MENVKDFVKEINTKRKNGGWYSFNGIVEGKTIQLKGYDTWLQIFRIDGIDNSGNMDISVKEFNGILNSITK